MPPRVDLVILFFPEVSVDKTQTKDDTQQAEEQYTRLLNLLKTSGLHAVAKRGEKLGELMILIKCPQQKLDALARAERFVFNRMCLISSSSFGFRMMAVSIHVRIDELLNIQGFEFYPWVASARPRFDHREKRQSVRRRPPSTRTRLYHLDDRGWWTRHRSRNRRMELRYRYYGDS